MEGEGGRADYPCRARQPPFHKGLEISSTPHYYTRLRSAISRKPANMPLLDLPNDVFDLIIDGSVDLGDVKKAVALRQVCSE